MRNSARWLALSTGLLGATSCAGPSTPLGAVWALSPGQARTSMLSKPDPVAPRTSSPVIRFSPSKQVLHGPSSMKIIIEDPDLDDMNFELAVRYNELDVSRSFMRAAHVIPDYAGKRMTIENPVLRLSAQEEHRIEVIYRNSKGAMAYSNYGYPDCDVFHPSPVRNLAGFSPEPSLIKLITQISREKRVNPAFSNGLIAQESAFNPKAVSWAKAVGLTQVTPIAEKEILKANPAWQTYPDFNERAVPAMRALILSGKVNAANEWRLQPERSVRGGIEYAVLLARMWSTPENEEKIRATFANPESARTQLILASYHSGYSRVLTALSTQGKNWIYSSELNEARKYVNRIMSYCSYFSEKETGDENAT